MIFNSVVQGGGTIRHKITNKTTSPLIFQSDAKPGDMVFSQNSVSSLSNPLNITADGFSANIPMSTASSLPNSKQARAVIGYYVYFVMPNADVTISDAGGIG